MKELKFRAWEKQLKEIIPVHDIDFEKKMINTKSAWRRFDEIELMQYTGLKDKNDKEVYERDILRLSKNDIGLVDYYKDGWRVKTSPKYPGDEWRTSLWNAVVDEFVVIGNIYKNPELLKER